jgi:EC042_2821-lke REase/Protein of unknown function (DUF3644)
MNLYGSYTKLLGNAVEALSAAVEIYNKPRVAYREECFVILLVNGWELLLKAILSNKRERLYYKKKPGEPYRSLSIRECLGRVEPHFPQSVNYKATAANLTLLIDYRDRAIHFYNSPGLRVLIYGLAQTCIVNFRDLALELFQRDITAEITLSLLPLSIAPPIDPVEFLKRPAGKSKDKALLEFSNSVRQLVTDLEGEGADTGRLMTVFNVHLVSTKKVSSADLVVGVDGSAGGAAPMLVQRITDPNVTHPYREVDIVGRRNDPNKPGMQIRIGNTAVGQYQLRAIVHHQGIKQQARYCWTDATGAVTRYSPTFVEFIKRLSPEDLKLAQKEFRKHQYGPA